MATTAKLAQKGYCRARLDDRLDVLRPLFQQFALQCRSGGMSDQVVTLPTALLMRPT
jgi:hypothetical protein